MVSGIHKSRTFRRVKVKTPGGRVVRHYRPKKPDFAKCQQTGVKLHGVARQRPTELAKLSKTQKRPQRPFGGVLSSAATRRVLIDKARSIE